jgi:hypothetical protein
VIYRVQATYFATSRLVGIRLSSRERNSKSPCDEAIDANHWLTDFERINAAIICAVSGVP